MADSVLDHDVDRSQLDDDDDGVDESKKNFVQELSEHVSREFHRLMKPRLEDMLDHAIDRPPSSDKVVDLVQGLLQQILQSFQPEDKLPGDRNEAAEAAKSESTSPPDSVEEPQDSSGIMDDLDFLHAGFIEDTAHPSALMNMAPISFNSQGVCDMFQKTVVDSLGNFPYNFEDLFQTSDELCSPPDSGYGSLDCLIAPDFEAGDRIGVKM